MGPRQEAWFYKQLIRSHKKRHTRWRLVGNQIVFSTMNISLVTGTKNPYSYDSWDGYQANKNRTLATLVNHNISNTIFLSGDSHAAWVSDLVWFGNGDYNATTGAGSLGVEFAGTAVSSASPIGDNVTVVGAAIGSTWVIDQNPELQWQDLYYRGYYTLDVQYEKVTAAFYGTPQRKSRNGKEIKLAEFEVLDGHNRLRRSSRGSTVEGGVVYGGILRGGKTEVGQIIDTNA